MKQCLIEKEAEKAKKNLIILNDYSTNFNIYVLKAKTRKNKKDKNYSIN